MDAFRSDKEAVVTMKSICLMTCLTLGVAHLLPGAASKAQAQVQALPSTTAKPADRLEYDGLTAALAIPAEVLLHKSRSFPVTIRVTSLRGQPVPSKVTLRAAFGKIQSGEQIGEGSLDIPLRYGVGTAHILFPDLTDASRDPRPVEVTVADNPFGFLASAKVLFRSRKVIEITDAPKTLVADGQSTAMISAIVKDQLGEPLEGVPCFVLRDLPNGQREVLAVSSDAQGIVTFTAPSSTLAGKASFQLEAEQLASDQLLLSYEDQMPKAE